MQDVAVAVAFAAADADANFGLREHKKKTKLRSGQTGTLIYMMSDRRRVPQSMARPQ